MEKERRHEKTAQFILSFDEMDKIVNGKLRVITTSFDMKPEEYFQILESDGNDFTGRIFHGKVIHVLPPIRPLFGKDTRFFQFELFGYADGPDGERYTIAGDYPHEAHTFPTEPWEVAEFDFDGTRPAWLYEGIKWHSEVSLARLGFDALTKGRPEDVILRVQGRGGERYFFYESPVEVTEKFTTQKPG